jgi:hypothetical protein
MSDAADKLIQFAKSQKMTKEEWMEAIDHLYAAQVDMLLENSGNDCCEQRVVFENSAVNIETRRELLN